VLISGATVLVAMAGMLFARNKVFTSIGVGAMIMVAAAMVGSLTVLPALMAKLGDRVDKGRLLATHSAIPSGTRRDGSGSTGDQTPPTAAALARGTWIRALTAGANRARPHSRTFSVHA
jgi:uncharacterized membrane protein YdfJ with MMPL/SSD domain